ncbi:hypothetical protein [Bifidobacterium gallicum]|uniref:Uncharacterized protein n=1 Tax=Bifidobacterium gallicum DSM 20093 = LMG 11596 TaxID=561180 RepID=D1NSU2_9BIFI|nr:hypothetical protein [Bifidobacterium gallicum]EFA23744.1 hypothetical protein BIFGAL_02852 [Bifidobacterium gallicum DSM 20093 = LMG 11596]KFI59238.1 hypothetical protein BGLCM_0831 [Bifidobacterium gallicum DSM 20093 = LMG 11596]
MSDSAEQDDAFDASEMADLEAAFASIEQEFRNQEPVADEPDSAGSVEDFDDSSSTDESAEHFEDELEGLLGNKAKRAVIVTRLTSASLLAAFCQLSDISADCFDSAQGAVAVLRNLDGDGPEAAAKDLTTVVSGLAVVLAVNRADKLEATLYFEGEAGEHYAPPLLFTTTAPFVEDLMLGISSLNDLKESDMHAFASGELTHEQALSIISSHTRYGRGGNSSIE